MVHTFECLGRFFALDVESGSLLETDELTKLILDSRNAPASLTAGAFSRFIESEIKEVNAEIDELVEKGILFTPKIDYAKKPYSEVIKAMCLNVSHNCNLKCEYCFADGGTYRDERKNMPLEVALKAIDFLIERSGTRKNLEVDFFGGEPLLNLDVVKQTVAYARKRESGCGKKFKFTITTNAVSLNDEIIDFFNREMFNVVLSIDGRKDVHNCVRKTLGGGDSFDKALENSLNFRKKRGDKQYYVRGTFTALNPDFASDALFLNDAGFDQISLEPAVLPDSSRLAIKDDQIPFLCEEYEKLASEYLKRRKTEKWFNFFHFMLNLNEGPCETKRLSGCGAGGEYVAVNPSGNVYPCHQFDGNDAFIIGNILKNEFRDEIPKRFSSCNVLTKPECVNCWAKYYCSGGCSANAFHFNGDINKPYLQACPLMRKRVECALAIGSIEAEK